MPGAQIARNLLLAALPAAVAKELTRAGKRVEHARGDVIFSIGDPVEEITFPISGLVSLTVDTTDGETVEVAVAGREGFVGASRYLGADRADANAVMQIPGVVMSVPAEQVIELAARVPRLRASLEHCCRSLLVELAQSAVCNQVHSVEQRTARWLLHAADRAGTTDLQLTHEFLAQMLAVRRASVTSVVGIFSRAGLIRSARGLIVIADRAGLAELTCECYGIVHAATPDYRAARGAQPSAT